MGVDGTGVGGSEWARMGWDGMGREWDGTGWNAMKCSSGGAEHGMGQETVLARGVCMRHVREHAIRRLSHAVARVGLSGRWVEDEQPQRQVPLQHGDGGLVGPIGLVCRLLGTRRHVGTRQLERRLDDVRKGLPAHRLPYHPCLLREVRRHHAAQLQHRRRTLGRRRLGVGAVGAAFRRAATSATAARLAAAARRAAAR
jgi:hypothetical protein